LILRKVKSDTEAYLGSRVEKAVITVPAYFNDQQRQATKEAGIIAGLDVLRIINEPTAAALSYGLHRQDIHTILVWDLGGGTFDVSILECEGDIFQVMAVSGNTRLGGDDYDQRLMNCVAEQCTKTCGAVFPDDGMTRQRLKEACQKAKIDLSTKLSTSIHLSLVDGNSGEHYHFESSLTREQFQEWTADLLEKMIGPTEQALADAELEPKDIDGVLLVGGATRMPAVQELARQLTGKEPYHGIDPDEVVAHGAAIQAGMLLGLIDGVILLDVLPLSLGLETQGGLFTRVIHRNTPLPASEARVFTTAADNQCFVDIQVLQGERELAVDNISLGDFQLQDVPSLPRGKPKIEVAFDVDVDGIVHVAATDLLSENTKSIKVVSSRGIDPDSIRQMIAEAEVYTEADRMKREQIEAGIQADSVIAAAEMAIEEAWGFHRDDLVAEIERGVIKVKQALADGSSDETRQQITDLRDLLRVIHSEMLNGVKQPV